ncbi:HpcH/HpaI aldolase/citrate lyase family protein [Rhodococcus sp. NPDC057529]|uniref:HpcH/HpaI aldolase family protein n=1 Tax=Rhodococcus sp. NPDC057529 TaxID=3346158 RepID=UPI0036725207
MAVARDSEEDIRVMTDTMREHTQLNRLRARLDAGTVCTSMVVRYSRSAEIAVMARAAGFDSLYVDLEHAPLTLGETSQICIAAQASGVTPLVRIPPGRLDVIGRVLDGGALGVIVPHVTTAAEARAAVAAASFPPRGVRSAAGATVQLGYSSMPTARANSVLNDATLVAVMIEAEAAVEHVDEIAAVDGVDLLLVGTNDLLGDLGIAGQYDHEELARAYERVGAACRKHGKHLGVGGLSSRLDLARRYVDSGACYVSVGTDTAFQLRGARAAIADLGPFTEPSEEL